MRVGLLNPYSYTYPGGVLAHIEALGEELLRRGHDVRVLSPVDPDDRLTRVLHRGAAPDPRPLPDNLVPLGRTIGWHANGAVSNMTYGPRTASAIGRELRRGGYDVLHVHEPNAGPAPWFAIENAPMPVVGTFHAYATKPVPMAIGNLLGQRRLMNKLALRIAVSDAARWTGERFYGGRYRVIPNGIDLTRALTAARPHKDHLDLLFIGRPEERKGLPVLLRAFEALRLAGVDARLTVAGAERDEVAPLLLDSEGVRIAGRVSEDEKWRLLHDADLLCAPSLGGESFGIVLLEALASGTPVVCSDIPGYRDVVRDGREGLLVPAGDAAALGEAIQDLALRPAQREAMSAAGRERARRFAWPHVAEEVEQAYEDALALPVPATRPKRVAVRTGIAPSDGGPRSPARRLPSLEPGRRPGLRTLRRGAIGAGALMAAALGMLAVHRIGVASIGDALLNAAPTWMVVGLALMCAAMLLRAEAWHATLRAALPGVRVRRRDAARGTMIGVLMSATLPARLGEPSRALIMARRVGRVRERLPVVLGTLVSQTLLNLFALAILGTVMFSTIGLFHGHEKALFAFTIAPFAVLGVVLALPALLRRGKPSRFVRVQRALALVRDAMVRVRSGLAVFRQPRLGAWAALTQLLAWGLQWLACYTLIIALGLHVGIGAAAAVLFAVNVTAILPATPSNLGVFQAACVAVLSAYGVSHTDALAYGIVLQAVEIVTAVAMGMPALLGEGMSFKDMRLRALHSAPVQLGRAARDGSAIEVEG
ncbi:MAG: lysylphosphatidylglycerol synthase domain-containing protein [Thermoleophilaceae bacterium]